MPTNLPPEVKALELEYLNAQTIDEKIKIAEKIIAKTPKHKGTETYLAEWKRRLKKLREEREKLRRARKLRSKPLIPKDCEVRVTIFGDVSSGKTTILKNLVENYTSIQDFCVGVAKINEIDFQVIECPSYFTSEVSQILSSSEIVVPVIDLERDPKEQLEYLKEYLNVCRHSKKLFVATKGDVPGSKNNFLILKNILKNEIILPVTIKKLETFEEVKNKIYELSGLMKVYTKEPGKKPSDKPLVLPRGSTVKDVAERIHKDFLKKFAYCRVWGKSVKFQGQTVGLNHVLEDGDIVEIHIK